MTTVPRFPTAPDSKPGEHPLKRIQRLAREAGMRSVARDLEDEIHLVERGRSIRDPLFRAGQPVWWFPTADNRPDFMVRTQRMIAATVKSHNQDQGTVLIEHHDTSRKPLKFLVHESELIRREIPR
jgi:hypothetical protein